MSRHEYDGDGAPAYELEFGDGHLGQMEDLGLRKIVVKKKMPKAEEVFIIVRELAQKKGGYFRWRTFHRAALAVMRPSAYQVDSGFKCTVGSMLRAQVKHRTILRVKRGLYRFNPWMTALGEVALPARPLYVCACRFNMTPEDKRDWRPS